MSTPDKTTMDNLLALEQTCRRITEAKGCLYPGDAEGLYWLLDALRLALAASQDEAEKAKDLGQKIDDQNATLAAENAALREALSQIANGYYTDAAGYNLTAIAQAALHPATKEGKAE